MLENPTPVAPNSAPVVKRYAPPNQRNRSLNRQKSGGFDRASGIYANEGEKNQPAATRNFSGDAGSSSFSNENARHTLIGLEGCSRSDAAQLLNDRWSATLHRYNEMSADSSKRPVMYTGSSASAWTQFRLPHQPSFIWQKET
ncbi:uncharacterized protein [Rutidosis leptorrhynchoides]|uniref:uncharacterized protein n=1 Tax=Rutidosis leptorrhynchoides TaxID=125765 RepID=UPI003A98F301